MNKNVIKLKRIKIINIIIYNFDICSIYKLKELKLTNDIRRKSMSLDKNCFTHLCLAIFEVMIGFILITGVWNFGNTGIEGKTVEYPFLTMGAFLIMLLLSVLIINAIFYLITKFKIYKFFSTKYKINIVIEIVIVLGILLISGYLRILMIKNFPLEVESDYKTYYTIAEFWERGL